MNGQTLFSTSKPSRYPTLVLDATTTYILQKNVKHKCIKKVVTPEGYNYLKSKRRVRHVISSLVRLRLHLLPLRTSYQASTCLSQVHPNV